MRFPSPTPLPPSDVALIAAYEAERGVTVCPPCRFSEAGFKPIPFSGALAGRKGAALRKAGALHRRQEILPLLRAKIPHWAIAKQFNVSLQTINSDARLLRKEGRL